MHLKVLYKWPNECMDAMLKLLNDAFLDGNKLPISHYDAKKLLSKLKQFTYVNTIMLCFERRMLICSRVQYVIQVFGRVERERKCPGKFYDIFF